MSIVTSSCLPHKGSQLCGQTLVPNDDSSLFACYPCSNITVCVSYEIGDSHPPYLRMLPAIQIPEFAREDTKKLLYTHEDDRFGDVTIDKDDGEIVMRRTLADRTLETAERELSGCLEFLDDVAYPALRSVIARAHRKRPRKGTDDEWPLAFE
ncbi:MAG: hypothetical protein KHY83_08720 [Coriobacteriia bacterium]|nr:hypothetical protein [Coriobacteriia bacterium]MBS5478729.1 hypothetical protein [Coriobacteriia bacterium]